MRNAHDGQVTHTLTLSQRELDAVTSRLTEQWVSLHRKRPRYLYHYTNAQGLLGMLQSNRIWATNSRFMNDPTEIAYAIGLVRKVESELEKKGGRWLDELKLSRILHEYEKNAKVYIACFCREGDLLSQWRGYGAVGGGYGLGFSGRHLGAQEVTTFAKPEPILRKVIYDRPMQERLVWDWLDGLSMLARARRRNPRQAKPRQLFDIAWATFNMFLSECLNCFKDPAYREEQEWRLIQFGRVNFQDVLKASFRTGGSRVVPYVELDFRLARGPQRGKLPLKVIRYGPTLDPKVTERSLRLLCDAYGYNERHLTIRRSGVPFTG
jgi:Protein of unknown function (DUF2971)